MHPRGRRSALAAIVLTVVALQAASAADVSTFVSVDLEEDGDAHWTVQVRVPLESEAEVEAFREIGGSEAGTEQFRGNMERIVASAAEATGRDMALTNFSTETRVEGVTRTWGVTVHSFHWSSFSAVGGDLLRVSGVISQLNLEDGDRLTVTGPDGWGVESVSPPPDVQDEGDVSWRGPQSFREGEPTLVLRTTGGEAPADEVPSPTAGEDSGSDGFSLYPVAAVASLLVASALFLVVRSRRRGAAGGERPVPDEDLVMRLLSEAGGQMRQAELVERTGWSASKVSKVTGRLEEEGRLAKRRWGKEKVLISQEGEDGE